MKVLHTESSTGLEGQATVGIDSQETHLRLLAVGATGSVVHNSVSRWYANMADLLGKAAETDEKNMINK